VNLVLRQNQHSETIGNIEIGRHRAVRRKTKEEKYDERMKPFLEEGKAAAVAGLTWEDCPYKLDLHERNAWLVGHKFIHRQREIDAEKAKRELERRKIAAFDYIAKNHTSNGGMHMSGIGAIRLGGYAGDGRTLLEAIESKMEQST
jgi:ribosome modulation factor